MTLRPDSVAEVARRSLDAQTFSYELADFLHEFGRRGEREMLIETPPLLRDSFALGAIYDTYLAAVAVSLATRLGAPSPEWTRDPERILREPWFASPGGHMRALLLVESPAAFRERNLFVTANALSVA
jgi:hypothetical protein